MKHIFSLFGALMCEVLSRNTVFVSNVDFSVGAAVPGPPSGFRPTMSRVRVSLDAEETFFSSLISQTATRTTNTTQPPRPEGPTRDPAPGPGLQPATRGPTFLGATEETRTQPATSQKTPGSGGRTTLPSMLMQKTGK